MHLQVINQSFTVVSAPSFKANPDKHGTNSETFILLNLEQKTVLIGGTEYGGEIKKSIFFSSKLSTPSKKNHDNALLGEYRRKRRCSPVFLDFQEPVKPAYQPILKGH